MLRARGAAVVDADALAREAVEPGRPALQAIASRWPEVVRDGILDRKALGAIVFAAPAERAALEAIVHPWIREESARRIEDLLQRGHAPVIYEAPLLFEKGIDAAMDGVILVAAPEPLQIARLMERDALSEEAALARIASQWPLEEKRARATFVLENDRDIPSLEVQVDDLWKRIAPGRNPDSRR